MFKAIIMDENHIIAHYTVLLDNSKGKNNSTSGFNKMFNFPKIFNENSRWPPLARRRRVWHLQNYFFHAQRVKIHKYVNFQISRGTITIISRYPSSNLQCPTLKLWIFSRLNKFYLDPSKLIVFCHPPASV